MKIPKNYYHDRAVLVLVSINIALFLLTVLSVVFDVNPAENPDSIIAYRQTTKLGQYSGPTSDLYQFALFAVITTTAHIASSIRLYNLRRHLAVGVLWLNILLLILTIVIFNALTKTL